ncbi:MAG TPA: hypothetical protein VKB25_02690 [Conexibacter sp.]|nr:hypothetical protein [Conexibacter sp.]
MLFDLQSRGRRGFIKVIYLGLAILMGGGLILFGIGTGTGGGGLFDAFSGDGSSTSVQVSNVEKRAAREVRLNPQDPRAWADLAQARYQTAGLGDNFDQTANQGTGQFTKSGLVKLEQAATAWQRYLLLDPKRPDVNLALLMAKVYSEAGLNEPAEAAEAMEIVTEVRPSASSYSALAQYAYVANQSRKGDLAAARAVALTPSAQRRLVRAQLDNVRRQVALQAGQRAIEQGRAGAGRAAPSGGGTQGVG